MISYLCGLQISIIVIVTIICTIISWIIFKYFISNDIFIIKSEKLQKIIIFFAISAIFLAILYFTRSDFKIIFKNPIFVVGYLVIIIAGINGIPKFINLIKIYNPNEFEDGEIIYIVDNFFEQTQNSIEMYDDKKFHFKSMNFIINKKCIVENVDGKYIIILNGIDYSIVEKNGELLNAGDIVKISKDNLSQGMIRKSTSIIVEKVNNKNEDENV
ncbi:MAG: hypothetical protein Q4D02_02770 [Clostridia bacterium]|nr:hypothetical protein [Clostridia bacterium]